ncbi:MAG: hypothetical protein ABIO99_09865 [Candidatus Limnocylindria bacterium]
MPDRLDAALRDLATELAFPPTPDLREVVSTRLSEPSRRWLPPAWPRSIALALVALVLVATAAAAAVVILPGLRITFMASAPTPSAPVGALGTRLALGEAVQLDSVAVHVPAALGQPDEVYSSWGGEVVTLVYASGEGLPDLAGTGIGLLVQQINGSLDRERIEKLVVEARVTITPVDVNGAQGFWIEGPPHLIRYRGPSGEERAEMTRLVGDTLVWEAGGTLRRIESGLGLAATRRIAESIGD